MMRSRASRLLAMAAGAAMLISSTAAAASPPSAPASAPPANPWVTLSMLNPAGAAALGGAAAAVQPDYPPPEGGPAGIGGIPWPVIAVWLAVIALDIYLLVKDDNDEEEFASPD